MPRRNSRDAVNYFFTWFCKSYEQYAWQICGLTIYEKQQRCCKLPLINQPWENKSLKLTSINIYYHYNRNNNLKNRWTRSLQGSQLTSIVMSYDFTKWHLQENFKFIIEKDFKRRQFTCGISSIHPISIDQAITSQIRCTRLIIA